MKHLKKSMFISTVLMVVMLIAALSTATFAWYSSNNNATSNAVKVGAAEAESANIGIGFMKGATANTIEFLNLVNGSNAGDMNPVIPVKYYDQLNDSTTYPARYASSNKVPETGSYVPGGLYVASEHSDLTYAEFVAAQAEAAEPEATIGKGIDYRRIVDLESSQLTDIVAASSYIHDFENGILTNLTGIGDNYEQIYTVRKYAYNDSVTVYTDPVDDEHPLPAQYPAKDRAISVTGAGVYTVITANANTCYKVVKVFTVNNSGTEYADFDFATTTVVSQSCAYTLSGNSWFPAENGYLVAYNVYATANYKANVTAIDTTAEKVGFAAKTAGTTNAGDVLSNVVSTNYAPITDILYDADNFAYVAKIYEGTADDDGSLSNKVTVGQTTTITYENFKFNTGSVDGAGYFQNKGVAATVSPKYSNAGDFGTAGTGAEVAVLQGRDSRGNATQTFYVTNNGSTSINLSVSLDWDGDIDFALRVALFMNGTYVGTLAGKEGEATAYGKILSGAAAKDLPTYAAHQSYNLGSLAAGNANAAEFQAVVWFDGNKLDDANAGKTASFVLKFRA